MQSTADDGCMVMVENNIISHWENVIVLKIVMMKSQDFRLVNLVEDYTWQIRKSKKLYQEILDWENQWWKIKLKDETKFDS